MPTSPADLIRIRSEVSRALDDFLADQRAILTGISADLAPCADAITDLLAGGKRLRAAFCYWGWRACGGPDGQTIMTAAAALELLHASALVHDDVMDDSDTRRGQPSVHKRFESRHAADQWLGQPARFGAGAAILIGDLLLAWTDEMLRTSGLPADSLGPGLKILDSMRTEVLAGQFLDLALQSSGRSELAAALRVVTYKSAKYTVERPLQLGAALRAGRPGGLDQAIAAAFTSYGIPLGIAFQLRDDVLGVFGDPEQTGKPVIDDLREGKRTVLLALARERSDAAQAAVLDRCVGDPALTDQAAGQVRTVITQTGALAECEQMISVNLKEALSALDGAPITSEAKSALADLAIAATARAG
jgi:geranylgeranyl diphosphate synthase, type I